MAFKQAIYYLYARESKRAKAMKTFVLFAVLTSILLPVFSFCADNDSLTFARLLPPSPDGWHINPPDAIFDRSNLYEFIDGGAEVYLSYGFRRLFHRTYLRKGQPDILVDLYDMGNGENSYGLFLHSVQNPDSTFGQGSQYVSGYLTFWKANYFVSILAFKETALSKKCVMDLGKFIEAHIRQTSPLPGLVRLLPSEGRVKNTLRYFHTYLWLQRAFHFPPKNILNIDDSAKIALAQYSDATTLAIIRYPSAQEAQTAVDSLTSAIPAFRDSTIIKFQKEWLMFAQHGRYIILAGNKRSPDPLRKYRKVEKVIR